MDGIILFAKKPGITSFVSLSNIKKALNTNKVGHTGTLDSFAQGLLVVCTGRLTKLAGNITEFDKTYKAVIKFGTQTDTLEYTGNVVKTTKLPTKEAVIEAIDHFVGEQLQQPPDFSAIHINGQRASDIARSGRCLEIPSRKINVFSAELEDIKLNDQGFVEACLVEFSVSKGTYIRSLARDIGQYCNSSAHLLGLYRTKVGNFFIDDAAGFSELENFTIAGCYKQYEQFLKNPESRIFYNSDIQTEILNKMQNFTKDVSIMCGFENIDLRNELCLEDFKNGKPLKNRLFEQDLYQIQSNKNIGVFFQENFYGMLYKDETGKIRYKFVKN